MFDVIKQIWASHNTEKLVNQKMIFSESGDFVDDRAYMDFTYRRVTNGPGYSAPGVDTADFDIEKDAGFGEQTAIVYDPDQEYVAVQYNHHGPRAGVIAEYFSHFSDGQQTDHYSWDPAIRKDVYAKLQRSAQQTKLRLRVDASTINDEMLKNNVALNAVQTLRNTTNAGYVEIILSQGEDRRGGPLGSIREIIRALVPHKEQPDAYLKKLEVGVKDQVDSSTEILDILKHRVVEDIPDDELLKTDGLRYTFDSRIGHINKVLTQWLRSR